MAIPSVNLLSNQPGGGLVAALGGINALSNNRLLRDINRVKAQYAPMTTQAEALSKLAYANMMGPQFLAKAINNPGFLASLSEDQKNAASNAIYRAGSGQGTGLNSINNLPMQPPAPAHLNPLTWIADKLKNGFENRPSINSLASSPEVQNTMPSPQMNREPMNEPQAPESRQTMPREDGETDESLAYEDWLNSPEGQKEVAKGDSANIPDKNKILKRWYSKKANEEHEPTWAERTGQHLGVVEEGKEAGKIRATARKELDQEYQQALQLKAPFEKLNSIITNPTFQKLRQIPGFQQLQMTGKANFGTQEEQKIIGQFQAAAKNVVAATVKGFGGRILASEIPLSESMKLSDKDTIGVMLGKLPTVKEFNELTLQRARLASKLMKEYHLDKGDALEQADKLVDGKAIREQVKNELNPISDEDIDFTAKQMGLTREQVIKRLRAEGRYNG